MSTIQTNNTDLQAILDAVNALPDKGSASTLQEKSVTPTTSTQTVTPDSSYDGLSKVTVEKIPSDYVKPSGSVTITENGTHDVSNYASAVVNVVGSGNGGGELEYFEFLLTTGEYVEKQLVWGHLSNLNMIRLYIAEGEVSKITQKSTGSTLWDKPLLPPKDTLENTSWADISVVCKYGLADTYWSIGDQKIISVDGTNYIVDIIGFNHDAPSNPSDYGRDKAGITFQLHECLFTTAYINANIVNTGGWNACRMRNITLSNIFNTLDEDLQSVIVPVDKITGVGGGDTSTVETTTDDLFLLSEREVFDVNTYSASGEGTQYQYYTSGNSAIKYLGDETTAWWLRSPRNSGTQHFCYVMKSANHYFAGASTKYGVTFAFCV